MYIIDLLLVCPLYTIYIIADYVNINWMHIFRKSKQIPAQSSNNNNNDNNSNNELANMNTNQTTTGGELDDNFFHINVFIKNSDDIVTIKCKSSYTIKQVRQLIKENYEINGSLKVLKTLVGTKLDNKQFTLSEYDIYGTTNLTVKIKPYNECGSGDE